MTPAFSLLIFLPLDIMVGLERTYYIVPEDVGMVEVCASIFSAMKVECPVSFAFNVLLSTVSDTATGNWCMALLFISYIVLETIMSTPALPDYIPVERILTFKPCDRRRCVNITILDDTQVEIDEIFYVNLERTIGLDRVIRLDPIEGIIQIEENDCEL